MKHALSVTNEEEMEKHIPLAVARAASKSMETSSRLSKRRWDAAQEHLRGALESAVTDPRGESVRPLEYITADGGNVSTGKGIYVKDRSLSKKDRKRAAKEAKREMRQANSNALKSDGNSNEMTTAVQGYTIVQLCFFCFFL